MADKVPVAVPKGKATLISSLMKPKWILTILAVVVVIIIVSATVFVSVQTGDSSYYPSNGIYTKNPTDMILNASNLDGYRQINPITGNNSSAQSQLMKGTPISDYTIITVKLEKFNFTENASAAYSQQRSSMNSMYSLTDLAYRDNCFMYERTTQSGLLHLTGILVRGNMLLRIDVSTNSLATAHDMFMKQIITAQLNKLANIQA